MQARAQFLYSRDICPYCPLRERLVTDQEPLFTRSPGGFGKKQRAYLIIAALRGSQQKHMLPEWSLNVFVLTSYVGGNASMVVKPNILRAESVHVSPSGLDPF